MTRETPGNYNGMTHAEAKQLAADVREQLVESKLNEHAIAQCLQAADAVRAEQTIQPINRTVLIVVLDHNDKRVAVTKQKHNGAEVTTLDSFDDADPRVWYGARTIIDLIKYHRRGGSKP